MKRYWLTLKAAYLPGWGLYEGIRELVQNARDAEIQDEAPMKVEFVYRQREKRPVGTIVITNEGTTIPKEAFLIGHTSKAGHSELIGKFGEGLKFGILALLRVGGVDIKIRNGSESWNPVICRHKDYEADVLAFDVAEGNRFENRVQIEIVGVSEEDWAKIQERFLFINPPHPASVIKVHGGQVLMSPGHQGMLFVKGMFVCKSAQLYYGYDVDEADIDRDRRMVSNIAEVTSRLLTLAVASGKLVDKVYDLLASGSPETSGISSYSLGNDAQQSIVDKFQKEYGATALPVESEDQVSELSHLGIRGVKLPWNLQSIISAKLGNAKSNIAKLKMNARHTFELSDLTHVEHSNFNRAKDILKVALAAHNYPMDMLERISIVEFNDPGMCGTYSSSDRTTRLARKELRSTSCALGTLIHEIAHQSGPDGTKQHEAAMGNLVESAFAFLMNE